MLVLTRTADQRIQIGEDISIVILRVHGHRVKIGIEAPRNVSIMRSELLPPGRDPAKMAAESRRLRT